MHRDYEGRGIFANRTKVVMQNKYRRMIRKLGVVLFSFPFSHYSKTLTLITRAKARNRIFHSIQV